MLIFTGKICPYCDKNTELVDGSEVYGKKYRGIWLYLCRPCDAYVGTHQGTTNALGRLANAELRKWKKLAHRHFDALWRQKVRNGFSKGKARGLAYRWLAEKLGIEQNMTHVGMFDVDLCKKTVEACKPYSDKILRAEEQGLADLTRRKL